MTVEALSHRMKARPWGTGLGDLVPEWVAILLFAATAALWFLVTDPVSVLGAVFTAPDEPLTRESAAHLYSALFGSFAVFAGFVGLGTLVFVPKPKVRHASDETGGSEEKSLDEETLRRALAAEREASRKQIVRARLAIVDALLRATPEDDPEEMARVVESGMQEILTELRREGRAEA